jgi:hypothetical protein
MRRSQVAFIRGAWTGGAQDPGAGGLEDGIERQLPAVRGLGSGAPGQSIVKTGRA